MSASAPALAPGQVAPRRTQAAASSPGARAAVRLGAFAALALYGALRWGTMLAPSPAGRLVGLVAVAVAVAGAGPLLAVRSRPLAVAAAVLAGLTMLVLCGLPLSWVTHLRLALAAQAIGQGLTALPRLLLPYRGGDAWAQMVMLMGAAVLLLDAALMLAFAMPGAGGAAGAEAAGDAGNAAGTEAVGDVRRAVAALPLIALAAVPLTLIPAHLAHLQGLVIFGLLAVLVWGERLPRGNGGAATLACALAAAAAMILAPALDSHRPWINYQALAAGIAGNAESFDWTQRYGPLNWPQDGREVLEVGAPRGDYWKAVNLDGFDGRGWVLAATATPDDPIGATALARWTERLHVTVEGLSTSDVIGAGELSRPEGTGQPVQPGASAGTWTTANALGPGDSYDVSVYSPHPSVAELSAAGTDYSSTLSTEYLALTLPAGGSRARELAFASGPQVPGAAPGLSVPPAGGRITVFPSPFGSAAVPMESSTGVDGRALLDGSPYARAYALALRLRAGTSTPYAYVMSVMHYLGHGYHYDRNPPVSQYPLISFLFGDRRGYCQQFAGAMALLLRLGGVPARVVAGFTSGQYDSATKRWKVSDEDAHAWVEAFFPTYGWVRFDPTPGNDPALQNSSLGSLLPSAPIAAPSVRRSTPRRETPAPPVTARQSARVRAGGGSAGPVLGLAVVLVLAGLAVFLTRPAARPTAAQRLAELERAFARAGRPLAPGVTLVELERRLHGAPRAAAYVRALRQARFAQRAPEVADGGRRALRSYLREGLGVSGALRALWALPPRRPVLSVHNLRSNRASGGHTLSH